MRAHLGKETVGGGAMLLAMVAMAACSSEECLVVNGADVWTAPHSMPLCVRDDLVVEGRNEAEFARLEQVIEISGSLLVHNNAIARLPALTALRQIGDGITIAANPDLTEIAGFPGLKRVPGTLYIGENQQLAVLDLGSELRDCGAIFLALHPRLTAVDGLDGLETVADDLAVAGHASLAEFGAPQLREVGGALALENNPALGRADFPKLTRIGGALSLVSNGLPALDGLPALAELGTLDVRDNTALRELRWDTLAGALSFVIIRGNTALRAIDVGQIDLLADAAPVMSITENPSLREIRGFAGVSSLALLSLADNPALAVVAAWNDLGRVEGRLQIVRNDVLAELTPAFAALDRVGELWIFGNASLAPVHADELRARVVVDGVPRVGDNGGEETALTPCPWPEDDICDEATGSPHDTGLCAADPEDCAS